MYTIFYTCKRRRLKDIMYDFDIWDSINVSRHILYKLFSNAHIFDDTANLSVTNGQSSELLSSVDDMYTFKLNYSSVLGTATHHIHFIAISIHSNVQLKTMNSLGPSNVQLKTMNSLGPPNIKVRITPRLTQVYFFLLLMCTIFLHM